MDRDLPEINYEDDDELFEDNSHHLIFAEKKLKPLTKQQTKFCDEYIATQNIKASLSKAGYSGHEERNMTNMLKNKSITEYIRHSIDCLKKTSTAQPIEILEFLTRAMRGEIYEECIGEQNEIVLKQISPKDRIRAGEMMLKTYKETKTEEINKDNGVIVLKDTTSVGEYLKDESN